MKKGRKLEEENNERILNIASSLMQRPHCGDKTLVVLLYILGENNVLILGL